ncbi:haloacid dehalogenase [Hahella sp. CCB-MM4]|uniref:GMP/IMP nucleotidase n=1 Tax=Hahella sp. (strain CCB-MM4) TaxID=1926491 RepID=UPI000B9B69B4|nr:GMP/IMP nucleotidase [Hahella sp. CCB-MM4]OZG75134.1 haloacid dehalogenase [Hahella sp. CCB-MM4]
MINWQEIKTVLLDMDGTLLDLHFDNYFWLEHLPRRFAEINNIPQEDAQTSLMDKIEAQQGHLNWYCLDYWSQELSLDVTALKREVRHLIKFRPHVEDFLKELQSTGHRVVLVTNAHRGSLDLKQEQVDLAQYMDRIISSHDFQIPKENPEFWKRVQEVEPFDPETTLLIDDSLPVLRSAKLFGIRHLLTILLPDSQKPRRDAQGLDSGIKAIDHFNEILPSNDRSA